MLDRDAAMELVLSRKPESHLVNHAVQTEAIMRALAGKMGQDEGLWAVTGLLHDLDYPDTKDNPSRHGLDAVEIIGDKLPEDALHAIAAHNEEYTEVAAQSDFDFALRAAESVTGLISAAALVRPTRMEGMKPKSLKKKMKDKSFAASVNRERIRECDRFGMELGEFLQVGIAAMAGVADETGIG